MALTIIERRPGRRPESLYVVVTATRRDRITGQVVATVAGYMHRAARLKAESLHADLWRHIDAVMAADAALRAQMPALNPGVSPAVLEAESVPLRATLVAAQTALKAAQDAMVDAYPAFAEDKTWSGPLADALLTDGAVDPAKVYAALRRDHYPEAEDA